METSYVGSESIALKQCAEYLTGLRFKLRMMGISVDGLAYIYEDNKYVLVSSSQPNSVLKNKSNSIAYHYVSKGSASDEWRISYANTNDNMADLLTKPLNNSEKRHNLIMMIIYNVF